jgi:hypothetical protein
MKAEGSDLKRLAQEWPQPAQPPAPPAERRELASPEEDYERWPFAVSALLILTLSGLLWAIVIGAGWTVSRIFS